MPRLSQVGHKVVTRLSQGCHKVVTRLSQGGHKVVTRLSQGARHRVVTRLSQGCSHVTRSAMSQGCFKLATTLYKVPRLSQVLSQGCHKVGWLQLTITTSTCRTKAVLHSTSQWSKWLSGLWLPPLHYFHPPLTFLSFTSYY